MYGTLNFQIHVSVAVQLFWLLSLLSDPISFKRYAFSQPDLMRVLMCP